MIFLLSLEKSYYKANSYYRKRKVKRAKMIMFLANILHSSDIDYRANIDKNVKFGHRGIGIVIHRDAVIGKNCHIMHNTTLAAKNGKAPIIEDNVFIGLGSTILGGVRVGSNSTIGAMSLVVHNVIENSVAKGIPAK